MAASIRCMLTFGCQNLSLHIVKRLTSTLNILTLHDRELFQNIFPEASTAELLRRLSNPQHIYCGFDPTADSLHIGNLLAVIALIHCQRAGHHPIALVGGATAQIGDPSGKTKERKEMKLQDVKDNGCKIAENLNRVFSHHENLLWKQSKQLSAVKIVNNMDWYKKVSVVEFLSKAGRHFRMGQMLAKHSVQSRLKGEEGMSFTEFTYQVFQSYDWLHLYNEYQCAIQIGGNDQLGNMTAGYEFISRVVGKPVFGITVPLVTTAEGDKLGKTAGNALWLDNTKTTPYQLYQYFLNLPDSEVERYLNLFTFLSSKDIQDVMANHRLRPESRPAQRKIAEQVLLLVHGESSLSEAKRWTDALFSRDINKLAKLSKSEMLKLFENASTTRLFMESGTTIKEMCMKAKCFASEADANRIIRAGGVHINHRRVHEPDYILIPGEHILPSDITLIKVGKKNFYVVKWES